MQEVQEKVQKIRAKPTKEWQALTADPIKVIRGPRDALFITDHHHGANAWRLAQHPMALCKIGDRPPFATEAEFWSGVIKDRLVRLADADGNPLTPENLPPSLARMPDDPYRSLAWRVRKKDGFCRSEMAQKEFAEFVWADWLRKQPKLPADAVRASTASVVDTALRLVLSPAARLVSGYVGDKPAGFECRKDS